MDKVNSFGLIKALIMETSFKTIFTDKENTNGLMVVFTMDNGLTTRWKAKGLLHGVMDVDMKAITKMIKSMVMELLNGLMVGSI
jgi:uncharacterized protein YdiU (UPF0061 family)